jgi:putative ABC transport system permease protein
MNILKVIFKQTWRDARAGDLRLLGLAVVIAVAAVTSVGFLADRVGRALERDAAQMLGADLVVESSKPIPTAFVERAQSLGLRTVLGWQFPSMVGRDGRLVLASIKGVEAGYPLRGGLRTTEVLGGPEQQTTVAPEVGQAWVDAQVLSHTGLSIGETIKVGDLSLKVTRVITYEPDRGAQFVNLAPRVMLRAEDLTRSGLIAPGSRIGYNFLVAGDLPAVDLFRDWLSRSMTAGQKIVTVEAGRPEIRRSLDRAQEFLALVAMLAVLIAAVAVALGARRFSQRHRNSVAVMRCLGATQAKITAILLGEFVLTGLLASLVGMALGWGGQALMVQALGGLLGADLPQASIEPALQGVFAGLWLLLAFAWPPLNGLRHVPPSQILRVQQDGIPLQSLMGYALGLSGFSILMWWVANDVKLGIGLAAGFFAAAALFAGLGMLVLWVLSGLRGRLKSFPVLRFALAGVVRRRGATIAQTSALAVGMMAILLLTIVRTDLLAGWQRTLPADAPNRFLINIQTDQVTSIEKTLSEAGLTQVRLSPMVRGRFIALNDRTVSAADYDDARAQRMVEREFNLSYAERLAEPGQIVAGRDLNASRSEVSLEIGLAKSLGLKVGDRLDFDVAGEKIRLEVTSLRRVDWDSMRANFFAITTPAALKDAPQTWMTAFYLPPDRITVTQQLVKQFPNLTVFDVGAILSQLQNILDKVSIAVQGLFLFSVFAGAIVLAAALSATRDERVREAALLRAFGATRRQLAGAQRIELLAVGALAGLLAAGGATLAAWALSHWVFEFDMRFSLWPWALGLSVCMLGAWLAGAVVLRGVLKTPPLHILRHHT